SQKLSNDQRTRARIGMSSTQSAFHFLSIPQPKTKIGRSTKAVYLVKMARADAIAAKIHPRSSFLAANINPEKKTRIRKSRGTSVIRFWDGTKAGSAN